MSNRLEKQCDFFTQCMEVVGMTFGTDQTPETPKSAPSPSYSAPGTPESPLPATRESRPSPATRESSPSPATQGSRSSLAAQESRPSPATQESRPSPATRESRSPATKESRPSPATRESRPSPATQESRSSLAAKESRLSPATRESRPSPATKESRSSLATQESRPSPATKESRLSSATRESLSPATQESRPVLATQESCTYRTSLSNRLARARASLESSSSSNSRFPQGPLPSLVPLPVNLIEIKKEEDEEDTRNLGPRGFDAGIFSDWMPSVAEEMRRIIAKEEAWTTPPYTLNIGFESPRLTKATCHLRRLPRDMTREEREKMESSAELRRPKYAKAWNGLNSSSGCQVIYGMRCFSDFEAAFDGELHLRKKQKTTDSSDRK